MWLVGSCVRHSVRVNVRYIQHIRMNFTNKCGSFRKSAGIRKFYWFAEIDGIVVAAGSVIFVNTSNNLALRFPHVFVHIWVHAHDLLSSAYDQEEMNWPRFTFIFCAYGVE